MLVYVLYIHFENIMVMIFASILDMEKKKKKKNTITHKHKKFSVPRMLVILVNICQKYYGSCGMISHANSDAVCRLDPRMCLSLLCIIHRLDQYIHRKHFFIQMDLRCSIALNFSVESFVGTRFYSIMQYKFFTRVSFILLVAVWATDACWSPSASCIHAKLPTCKQFPLCSHFLQP